jgi:hypothetical protein
LQQLKSLIFTYFILLSFQTLAITISGKVVNEKNEPMPFVNVIVKESSIGSSTNMQGFYQLELENQGKYEIVYRFVGYKTHSEYIVVSDNNINIDVKMELEVTYLKEVVVNSKQKDPAYEIMRNAILKRKFHLKEIESYKCKAYVKGLIKLDDVPGKFLGVDIFSGSGLTDSIIYFSESVSEVFFEQPNKFKERVISSKVSGDNKGFSYNSATSMSLTFYEPIINAGLNERGFISPLSNNAFLYYKFRLLGTFVENGRTINKIQVIPIRKNDPVFSGIIYIVEDEWRIHSLKLKLDRNAIGDYVDTLTVTQNYTPINDSVWVMTQQRFNFDFSVGFKLLKFKGSGYFISVLSNYKVPLFDKPVVATAAPNTTKEEKKIIKKQVKKVEKQQKKESKELFNKEIVVVEKDANKIDTSSWTKIRPIPLTQMEIKDYKRKDSIQLITTSDVYIDSVNKVNNRFKWSSVLFGYSYRDRFRNKKFSLNPVYSNIQYNTMEGLVLNLEGEYEKDYDDNREITIAPYVRYGFANQHINSKIELNYLYKPEKFARLYADAGKYVTQFNRRGPITPLVNTIYTLLNEDNFLKQYEKVYARVGQRREIFNGVLLSSFLEYAHRMPLYNTTNFTFRDIKNKDFTPNISEINNNALIFDATIRIRFKQEYFNRPNQKIIADNKYPLLFFTYRKGINAFKSDINFDFISFRIEDDIPLRLLGNLSYEASVGGFINSKRMFFADYYHFNGNQTIFAKSGMDNFFLLDYYTYSTNNYYLQAFAEHHFDGFILNKFPLLRKLRWQEVIGVKYLYTDKSLNYIEAHVGLERVFKIARIDFVTAFQQNKKVNSGIRIGIGF